MMHTDIAQLVSVALYSPKPDESVAFFHDMLGLEISHREGQSVYMRAYEDFYQYSLKITESKQAGMEELTWRASSADVLEGLALQIESSDLGMGWIENDYAHGRSYKFCSPDGHCQKVLWDLDYFKAPPELASKLREQKIGDSGAVVGSWLSVSALVHEVALMRDSTGSRGRFHHVAYWYGSP